LDSQLDDRLKYQNKKYRLTGKRPSGKFSLLSNWESSIWDETDRGHGYESSSLVMSGKSVGLNRFCAIVKTQIVMPAW